MMTWTKELDEAAILATRKGCWHILLFYLLCGLAAIPTSFLVFSQVFINATPEHWCAPPSELQGLGLPDELLRNLTVPQENGVYETCRSYSIDMQALYNALKHYYNDIPSNMSLNNTLTFLINNEMMSSDTETRKLLTQRIQDAVIASRMEPISCPNGWKYNTELYKRTLVTEFSLVCSNEWLPSTSNALFWVGSLIGNLFFGWISDRYGRRPTILLMILLEVPLFIVTSFPGSYRNYIILRVLGGLFFPALYQQPFILALELMPPARRTFSGIIVSTLFAGGICIMALLAFLLRDWFYLSLAMSVPFIVLFGYYWLIPESPRWLVGRGRIADAENVLKKLAKRNGIILSRGFLMELHKKIKDEEVEAKFLILPSTQMPFQERGLLMDRSIHNMLPFKEELKNNNASMIENKENLEPNKIVTKNSDSLTEEIIKLNNNKSIENTDLQHKTLQLFSTFLKENKKMVDQSFEVDYRASLLDIFRYPNIRKKFLILTFNWISLGVVYNGLSYNTPNLGVDDYIAFFIGGAVEIPSYFLAWYCMERYGRRWVLCIFMHIGGLACLSCALVPDAWPWVTVSLAMLGRLCAGSSFAVFYVQIGEMLPTVIRAQAMGAASVVAGLGLLTCPYIVALTIYFKTLPLILMGVLSVLAGVTSLLLPETLNQPLPQTLEDGETWGRNFKLLSCVTRSNL